MQAVFQPATDHSGRSDETAAQEEQACGFRNFTRGSETAEPPLVDVRERCAVQPLNRDAVDNRALSRLDAEKVFAVGVYGKYLLEDLAAGQCVVNSELDRGVCQTICDVDVEDQLLEGCSGFELNRDVRELRR